MLVVDQPLRVLEEEQVLSNGHLGSNTSDMVTPYPHTHREAATEVRRRWGVVVRDTGTSESDDADGWLAMLVHSELDDLYRHVRVLYPLTNSDSLLHAVFAQAAAIGVSPEVGPRAWLRQLARREVRRGSDDRARRRQARSAVNGLRDAAEHIGGDADALGSLIEALGRLDVDEQELLRLSSVEDLDCVELAWILERDPDEVATQLNTARARLRAGVRGASEQGQTGNG